ncbi:MAG: hypothetical protein GXP48_02740 [Acidobacteria bacterium]|nr:hypothetical protein [Acidobacteriota bacterium]
MNTWEEAMALDLNATSPEEILLGLLLKDLLHGGAYDVDVDEPHISFSVDYVCGDELEGDVYRLLIAAEVEGPHEHDIVRQFTEELLDELVEEAGQLAEAAEDLGEIEISDIEMKTVPEDKERWDLVIPDWLAPEGAEVPFGFRSFKAGGTEPWPSDQVLDVHGRVLLVPVGNVFRVIGTPLPDPDETEEDED